MQEEIFSEDETNEEKTKQKQIIGAENKILNAAISNQRTIRRKNAKELKIPWHLYRQIEKNIILSRNDCPNFLKKKFKNKII